MTICFLDTEFTDLLHPQLLSLGLVALVGRQHYGELDLTTAGGQARLQACSDFVRHAGVIDQWGHVPRSAGTELELGRRAGEWLLELARESGTRVEVAYDYATDYELLEVAIRDAGLWDRVREVVAPVNIGALTDSPECRRAAEGCFRDLKRQGLMRHHAMADAFALRAAYLAVRAVAARMAGGGAVKVTLTNPGVSLLPPLEVEVATDAERRELTLSMDEFDPTLIAEYLRHSLTAAQGVGVQFRDSDARAKVPENNRHHLFIRLCGRVHPSQVVEMADGRFTVRLGDPRLDLHRRAHETARNVLRALHTRGVESLVVGDVASHSLNEWNPDSGVEVVLPDRAMADSDLRALRELAESVATAPVFVSTACGESLFSLLRFGHFVWNANLDLVERGHRGSDGGRDNSGSGDGDGD